MPLQQTQLGVLVLLFDLQCGQHINSNLSSGKTMRASRYRWVAPGKISLSVAQVKPLGRWRLFVWEYSLNIQHLALEHPATYKRVNALVPSLTAVLESD